MQIRRVLRRFMTVRCVVVLFIIVGFATIIRYTLQKKFSSIPIVDSVSSKFYLADPIDLLDAKISLDNKRFQSYPEDYFDRTNLTCQYPRLTIDNAEVWKYLQPVKQSKPECEKSENWVYVENGTFRINEHASKRHGTIVCAYRPIVRGKNDFSTAEGARLFPVVDKMPLVSDFFRADCRARDGSLYSNIHSGIMFDAGLHMRHIWNPMVKTHLGYNVLMFGFDSVSRMTFMRFLPKSYSYLIKELGAVVMKGYNIVGDGTPAALLPILTGQTERELPEARRGRPGAEPVDRFPWIWNKFKANGYVTQWGEDMQHVGTFHMRLTGFQEIPVDHYGRPLYLYAESIRVSKPLCFGSITRFKSMLNWIQDFFMMYPNQPKFSFLFHSHYSHDSNNRLPYADDELVEFLRFINENGYLDRTMLIVMTDHGARFSTLRKTQQGKLEERLPFVSIRMPKSFQDNYPHLMKNLRINSHRLTTPFDIHETFQHMFDFHSKEPYQPKSNRSYSFFQVIPKDRTCSQAHAEPHWCACATWKPIDIKLPLIEELSIQSVKFLNSLLVDYQNECLELSLKELFKASQFIPNSRLENFIGSKDTDGREPAFSEKQSSSPSNEKSEIYQIQFETTPGGAQFELTAEYVTGEKKFLFEKKRVSRMNKYGQTSACIAFKRPEIREICYCNSNLSTNTTNTTAAH